MVHIILDVGILDTLNFTELPNMSHCRRHLLHEVPQLLVG